nr:response regulator [Lachnospiraceae bacterium]
ILDPKPIGLINWDEREDNDDYGKSFIAPDANILIVDDNAMSLRVFEELLKKTEIHIKKANSGKTALQIANEQKFDIIFMDHMMPEIDGIEAMRIIRTQNDGMNKETPIIVLTANDALGTRDYYVQEGFTDYVSKPIYPKVLEDMILQYLPEEKCIFKNK